MSAKYPYNVCKMSACCLFSGVFECVTKTSHTPSGPRTLKTQSYRQLNKIRLHRCPLAIAFRMYGGSFPTNRSIKALICSLRHMKDGVKTFSNIACIRDLIGFGK